jgi:hypothetical protein
MQEIQRNASTVHRQAEAIPPNLWGWVAGHWRTSRRAMLAEIELNAQALHRGGVKPSEIVRAVRKGCRH